MDSHGGRALIFMANHRSDPTEPFEEGKAFEEESINQTKNAEGPSINQWDRKAFLPEQRTHRGEMKLTMLQLLKLSTDRLNVTQ